LKSGHEFALDSLKRIDFPPISYKFHKFFSEDQIFRLDHYLGKETLRRGNQSIPLTSSEAHLLKIFASHIGTYLSREILIEMMDLEANSRTIDVQITRLRKKIEDDPKHPNFIQTVRNKGYILWDH